MPALSMMEDMMPSYGLSLDEKTFSTIMQGFIEEGDISGALRVKEQMVEYGYSCTNVTINVLVNRFCKLAKVKEALGFIQEMEKSEGFVPDRFTFNALVNGLCKLGHVKHALEMMDVMVHEGFDLYIYTYNVLIFGLCKFSTQKFSTRGCRGIVPLYNTLISTFCKENRLKEVVELAHGLTSKRMLFDAYTLNSLIQALCLTRNHKVVMEVFNEIKNEGYQLDEFVGKNG